MATLMFSRVIQKNIGFNEWNTNVTIFCAVKLQQPHILQHDVDPSPYRVTTVCVFHWTYHKQSSMDPAGQQATAGQGSMDTQTQREGKQTSFNSRPYFKLSTYLFYELLYQHQAVRFSWKSSDEGSWCNFMKIYNCNYICKTGVMLFITFTILVSWHR